MAKKVLINDDAKLVQSQQLEALRQRLKDKDPNHLTQAEIAEVVLLLAKKAGILR
jgi:hypothetical protein